jgi:hypothetical protein
MFYSERAFIKTFKNCKAYRVIKEARRNKATTTTRIY